MKISIVTISFNQAQFLRECIESVLNQNHSVVEYIVVDPGSTDGSREIIDSYGDRIIRVYEKDSGPADGLNRGFARATGDIYGYINSDDYLLPNTLRYIAEYFSQESGVDVVSGAGKFVDANGLEIGKVTPSKFSNWLYAYGAVTLFQQGSFFRSNVFKNIGGFNVENKICWDGELFVDFYKAGAKFSCVRKDCAAFRMYGSNISSGPIYGEKLALEHSRIFEKIINRAQSKIDPTIRLAARFIKLCDLSYLFRRVLSANYSRPPHARKEA